MIDFAFYNRLHVLFAILYSTKKFLIIFILFIISMGYIIHTGLHIHNYDKGY